MRMNLVKIRGRSFLYLFLFLGNFIFLHSLVWSGGSMDSGGVDFYELQEGTAWFTLGPDRPHVSYCLKMAPNFGVEEQIFDEVFQEVMMTWKNYFQEKNVLVHPGRPEFQKAVIYQKKMNCDGSEDLTFYLGLENEAIKEEKKKYYRPVAFSKLQFFSMKKAWGQGLIWVTSQGSLDADKDFPNWQMRHHLFGILLHEMGHVLGSGHRDGTIMGKYMTSLLEGKYEVDGDLRDFSPNEHHSILTHIEHNKELVSKYGPWEIERILEENPALVEKIFHQLAGRSPVGQVRVLYRKGNRSILEIVLKDEIGEKKFPILNLHQTFAPTTNSVFKTFIPCTPDEELRIKDQFCSFLLSSLQDYVIYGQVEGEDHKKFPIYIERNMGAEIRVGVKPQIPKDYRRSTVQIFTFLEIDGILKKIFLLK